MQLRIILFLLFLLGARTAQVRISVGDLRYPRPLKVARTRALTPTVRADENIVEWRSSFRMRLGNVIGHGNHPIVTVRKRR